MQSKENARRAAGANVVRSNYSRTPNFADVKAAARHHWFNILPHFGLPEEALSKKHGPCPLPYCGGTDRFRFDDKEGRGTFYCNQCGNNGTGPGAGDGFELLRRHLGVSHSDVKQMVWSYVSGDPSIISLASPSFPSPQAEPKRDASQMEWLKGMWEQTVAVTEGDPVDLYLRMTRKLPLKAVPICLRYHPNLPYCDENGKWLGNHPAMVALITNASGEAIALHRTYLSKSGEKADVPQGQEKKFAGSAKGGAIRLFTALDRLAIGEGIESALAAHLVGDCPAWAAGSVAQMAKIEIPDSIKHVLIYADNDKNGAGQKAAYALCKRLREEGKNADVRIAPDVDTDWVDWICNLSADDIAEVDE